jgi:hypothetical protein
VSDAPDWIDRILVTDPRDVGCDEARASLHVYADLVAAGADPAERYPGVAARLAACDACSEDLRGLSALIGDEALRTAPPERESHHT